MNDDKIKNIFENKIIREKLYNADMYPMIGPTGPRGKKIEILDSYDTYEKLLEKHPKGNSYDCYLIGDILYIWNQDKKEWMATESIKGPTGLSETIKIRNAIIGEENDKAQVIDNFDGEKHILDFIISKGKQSEKGLKEVQGEVGPTGPSGIQELKGDIGPKGDKDITINNTGLFEITAPANLRIKTEITGDKKTSNILFSTINVLITGYYV